MVLILDLLYPNIHQLSNKLILILYIEIHTMHNKNKIYAQKQIHNLIELEIQLGIIILLNNKL
jgi:hypothetical protein